MSDMRVDQPLRVSVRGARATTAHHTALRVGERAERAHPATAPTVPLPHRCHTARHILRPLVGRIL
eukprot:657417-Prymnesium_polylepis.1